MYRSLTRTAASLTMLACGAIAAYAAGPKITDPAKVDSDYALQGEYSGSFENNGETLKAGAQIIALGNGEFAISFYPGGLPGDGFGRDKSKVVRANGKLENGQVKFTGEKGPPFCQKTESLCLIRMEKAVLFSRKYIVRARRLVNNRLKVLWFCLMVRM